MTTISGLHRSQTAALITADCSSWLIEGTDREGHPLQVQVSEDALLYYYYLPKGLTKAEAVAKAAALGWQPEKDGPVLVLPYGTGFQPYWAFSAKRFLDPVTGEARSGPAITYAAATKLAMSATPMVTAQQQEIWDVARNLWLVGGFDKQKRPLTAWVGQQGVVAWTYLDEGIPFQEAEKRAEKYKFQWIGQSIIEDPDRPVWSMRAIQSDGELVEFHVDLKTGAEAVLKLARP
jgi:uncharacterized protein YpmB